MYLRWERRIFLLLFAMLIIYHPRNQTGACVLQPSTMLLAKPCAVYSDRESLSSCPGWGLYIVGWQNGWAAASLRLVSLLSRMCGCLCTLYVDCTAHNPLIIVVSFVLEFEEEISQSRLCFIMFTLCTIWEIHSEGKAVNRLAKPKFMTCLVDLLSFSPLKAGLTGISCNGVNYGLCWTGPSTELLMPWFMR